MAALAKEYEQQGRQAELRHFVPLSEQLADELEPLGKRQRKNSMRNKSCVCGSGMKFKRCCWSKFA
jgi:uncharacterized protein YecA (UPF0149 family)